MTLGKESAIARINALAQQRTPFLFLLDFDCVRNKVIPLSQVDPKELLYKVNGSTNVSSPQNDLNRPFHLDKKPVSYECFKTAFDKVQQELSYGNSYLVNLTFPTPIHCSHSLEEIFHISKARYKLWHKEQFVVFSPEIFVQIQEGEIRSYPMKGTIDATLPNARQELLTDTKEMAEHATIVDLIRNDMSIHARNVSVKQFRYIEQIKTHEKVLLQASSEITGELIDGSLSNLGDVLFSLLPAGSISGAPKPKTLDIIRDSEEYDRGYYTGVFGIFDGKNLDSGVMIRYIENTENGLTFKSGGGIHFLSDPKSEYKELIDKVYVPIH